MRSISRSAVVWALALGVVCALPAAASHDGGCDEHPANDDHGSAEELPLLPWATAGTTTCATPEPGEPEVWCVDIGEEPPWSRASVWYRYEPSETERVTVHVFGPNLASYPPDPVSRLLATGVSPFVIHVYQGSTFDSLKYACRVSQGPLNLSQASFQAVERKTYYIQVSAAEQEGPRGEQGGDFVLVLAPRIATDPGEILP